eukprot:7580338-Alexandrium_andersonii.AAC.1
MKLLEPETAKLNGWLLNSELQCKGARLKLGRQRRNSALGPQPFWGHDSGSFSMTRTPSTGGTE